MYNFSSMREYILHQDMLFLSYSKFISILGDLFSSRNFLVQIISRFVKRVRNPRGNWRGFTRFGPNRKYAVLNINDYSEEIFSKWIQMTESAANLKVLFTPLVLFLTWFYCENLFFLSRFEFIFEQDWKPFISFFFRSILIDFLLKTKFFYLHNKIHRDAFFWSVFEVSWQKLDNKRDLRGDNKWFSDMLLSIKKEILEI